MEAAMSAATDKAAPLQNHRMENSGGELWNVEKEKYESWVIMVRLTHGYDMLNADTTSADFY